MTGKELEELKGFEKIIKHLDIGYFKADANGIILDHNPSFSRIFGFESNESLVGLSAIDLWANPEDFNKYLKEITEKGKLRSYIHKARKKNGETIILHTHSHVYKNKEKNRFEAEGTIFDITEKYVLEQKLKESEQKYRNIIENSIDAIVIIDLDGKFKYISPQLSKMVGREANLETKVFVYIHPDDVDYLKDAFFTSIRNKNVSIKGDIEFRVLHNDGHYIWLSNSAKNYYDENGNVIGFITLLRDVTDKKEAEQKLKESEEKYRLISENANDMIVVLNEKFEYEYLNENVHKEIMGYSKEDIIGKSALDFIHPNDIEKAANYLKDGFTTGEGVGEVRVREKKGDYLLLEARGKIFIDKDGNRKGLLISRDITERKMAEQKLRESEEKYRNLFERAPFSIWLIDFDGTIIDCNMASNSLISKIDVKNLIGKNLTDLSVLVKKFKKSLDFSKDLISESIVSRLRVRMQNVIKGEVQEPIEFQYHRFDGKSLWVNLQSSLVKIGDKELIQVIIQDITERKKIEQELKESEKKYRNLIENTKDAIVIVGFDGKYKYISPQFYTMLGERKINLEDDIFDLIHPDEQKQLIDLFSQAVRQKSTLNPEVEFRILHKDGHYIWVLTSTQNYYDDEGNMVGFISDLRDVTAIKVAEEKLKKSEEKYRGILDNLEIGYYEVDLKGNYLFTNKFQANYIGYSKEELAGKNYRNFFDKETERRVFKAYNEVYSKNLPKGLIEVETVGPDGIKRTFESSIYLKYDSNGKKIGFHGTVYDISERKKMEQKLKESEEKLRILNKELEQKVSERTKELEKKNLELQKLDQAKDDFIAMAAHELKTPLISVAGYTEFILMKYGDILSSDVKVDLEIVQKNIKRLETLMNQLLDVMKIESHKIELNLGLTNISNIIYGCLHELNYLFKEKNHEMILNIDNEIFLQVDKNRIFQIFSNLISNATKFTPNRGKIEISAKKEKNHFLFEVKDNGIGLSENDLDRIFKKFETIAQNINENFPTGSGLGLSISKGFIEAHGGKIWATSEGLNKGMTIHFTIPV